MSKSIKDIQSKIKNDKNIIFYDRETLEYVTKPIGKTLYKTKVGRPKKEESDKAKPSDRIVCPICKEEFVRSNRTNHNKTKIHKKMEQANKNLKKLLID
jgi:hypothetical protein